MRIYAFLSLLVLSILTVASFFPLPTYAIPGWTLQTISTSALNGGIASDSSNYPHIAYTQYVAGNQTDYSSRNGDDYLMYTSWNGSMWTNQTVAANAGFLDLVLDSHNNAHILFKKMSGVNPLMYARWTGYDWSIQTIDSQGGSEGSIALDSADNPHIAYFTSGNATSAFFLKYTSWTGSSWSNETVDAGDMTYLPSLKLDTQSRPHIMYETEKVFTPTNSSEAVKHAAFNNASGWTIQTVGQNIRFRNMVLDSNGYPHFSYGRTYASWNGAAWNMQSFGLNFNSSVGYGNSYLALDKQNYPHFDFIIFSEDSSTLTYVRWTGTEWDIQTVANAPEGAGPIAIDSNGNPHILYPRYGGSLAGSPLYILMYATTTMSTQSFTAPLLIGFLIAMPVIVILFVIALVYRWKKNQKP